ncbi:MAG TPA: pilus assembly protein PilP [Thermoanaerobaculia bacterium]|jgi:type IV pilus assembly protein PilP|nr:pilus assembly protein PilP [Thermoanaerobaculia bacterium]
MKTRNLGISLLIVLAAVASVVAQSPATGTAPAVGAATDTSVQKTLEEILEEPTTTDTYRYDPQGRRDPFRSLIGPAPKLDPGQRPAGVPGFLIDEMKLQGIFQTRAGLTAMVNGPDNKGYTIKVGDKVLDGEVIRITTTSVVFRQQVNDPTRIERFREVVKDLSPSTPKR